MQICIPTRWLPLVLAGAVALAGCTSSSTPELVPERHPPAKAGEVALETYDANGDGKIADAELDECLSLKHSLPRVDTNGDQGVSAEEIANRIQAYEDQSTLMSTVVQVVSKQGPVSGATVTLALEPFMGDDLPTYTATTDASGTGPPMLEGTTEPVLGIPLGFYRVTISTPRQGTVERGCEVADDAPTSNRLVFSLDEEAPLSGGGRFGRR